MQIVVLMKEVPDTWGDRNLNLETGLLDRAASEPVLDEITERALEVALTYRDEHPDTEVVLLAAGPEGTLPATLRKGLAMGADRAVHITDPALLGADTTLTAEVLAAALKRTGFDLVIAGNISTDGGGGVLPSMLAELLRDRRHHFAEQRDISETAVSGQRRLEAETYDVQAALPAVISITEALPGCALPELQRHHGGEEEALRDLVPGRSWPGTGRRSQPLHRHLRGSAPGPHCRHPHRRRRRRRPADRRLPCPEPTH